MLMEEIQLVDELDRQPSNYLRNDDDDDNK